MNPDAVLHALAILGEARRTIGKRAMSEAKLQGLEREATRCLYARHVLEERRWPGDDVIERTFLIVKWASSSKTPKYKYTYQPFQGLPKEITRDDALDALGDTVRVL